MRYERLSAAKITTNFFEAACVRSGYHYTGDMEPASTIVKALGGPSAVARIVSTHRVTVHKWMQPREKGGTGGVVPHWHIPALVAHAQRNGVDITEADFALRPQISSDQRPSPVSQAGA